jgi:hypothetical protein
MVEVKEHSWGNFEDKFLDELVQWIDGRRVLEVFAGNGLLAKKLRERGVEIIPTTTYQGHDYHEFGMHCEVEEIAAHQAVKKYGDACDILLMSWPVPTEDASVASILWGEEKPLVYIGEVTDLKIHQLGGCASDSFFEMTKVSHNFQSYRQARSGIEHAVVRQVLPEAREILKRSLEEWDRTLRTFK